MALPTPRTTKDAARAQLYTLSNDPSGNFINGPLLAEEANDQVLIDFPNLPETIKLARSSNWDVVSVFGLPNGIHIYKSTNPLEIPISFTMHCLNPYSINGPETLLQVAAKLHALIEPIDTTLEKKQRPAGQIIDGANPYEGNNSAEENLNVVTSKIGPPACVLNIMIGSNQLESQLGIVCLGYVKSVDVELGGPYRSSNTSAFNRNLPTTLTASFTFVNAPGYNPKTLGVDPSVKQSNFIFTKNNLFNNLILTSQSKNYNVVTSSK